MSLEYSDEAGGVVPTLLSIKWRAAGCKHLDVLEDLAASFCACLEG